MFNSLPVLLCLLLFALFMPSPHVIASQYCNGLFVINFAAYRAPMRALAVWVNRRMTTNHAVIQVPVKHKAVYAVRRHGPIN
jgi:hypothetical protein